MVDARELLHLFLQPQRLPGILGHDDSINNRMRGGIDQSTLQNHRRQVARLHVEQVVIKIDSGKCENNGRSRRQKSKPEKRLGEFEPKLVNLLTQAGYLFLGAVFPFPVSSFEEQNRQDRHHRHQADNEPAAANNAHFFNALEFAQPHCQEGSGRCDSSGENPEPGIDQRNMNRFGGTPSFTQLFLKAADQVDAEIDSQANQHRQESNGEEIQAANDQRGPAHRKDQPQEQAERSHNRPMPLPVSIAEDEKTEDQRNDTRESRILLALLHLVKLQNRFACDADVYPSHQHFDIFDQIAQPAHGLWRHFARNDMQIDQVHFPVAERDILLPLGLFSASEESCQTGRHGDSGLGNRAVGSAEDSLQGGQRIDHIQVLLSLGLLSPHEAVIHIIEEIDQIGNADKILNERRIVFELGLQIHQHAFIGEKQGLIAHHFHVSFIENVGEEIGFGLQPCAQELHEHPVAVEAVALHDDHDVILVREFLLILEENLVILLVLAHQLIAVGAELEVLDRVPDRDHGQEKLGDDNTLGIKHCPVGRFG